MNSSEDVYRQLYGAWRMMTGKRDGLYLLNLSSDGFWASFFAIVVAGPAMLAGWVPLVAELAGESGGFGYRFSILLRVALADIGAWVLPFVGLAAIAPYAGVRQRFVHYVVAINWGSAILAWLTVPVSLLRLFAPNVVDLAASLSLVVFLITLVLYWRLTNAALEKGAATTTAVFVFMLVASLLTLFALHDLLGLGGF